MRQQRHRAECGASDLVCEPYVEQPFCRHTGCDIEILRGTGGCRDCKALVRHFCRLAARDCGAQQVTAVVHDYIQRQHHAHRQPAAGSRRVGQSNRSDASLVSAPTVCVPCARS